MLGLQEETWLPAVAREGTDKADDEGEEGGIEEAVLGFGVGRDGAE